MEYLTLAHGAVFTYGNSRQKIDARLQKTPLQTTPRLMASLTRITRAGTLNWRIVYVKREKLWRRLQESSMHVVLLIPYPDDRSSLGVSMKKWIQLAQRTSHHHITNLWRMHHQWMTTRHQRRLLSNSWLLYRHHPTRPLPPTMKFQYRRQTILQLQSMRIIWLIEIDSIKYTAIQSLLMHTITRVCTRLWYMLYMYL